MVIGNPGAIVTDHCFAMMNAVVRVFHNMTLGEYISLPDEQLRTMRPHVKICRSHEAKAIAGSVAKDYGRKCKDQILFVKRALKHMLLAEEEAEMLAIWSALCILLLSNYDSF